MASDTSDPAAPDRPRRESDPLDDVLAGRCVHGHAAQRDCGACLMTRYLAVSLRQMLGALFGGPRA